VTDRVERQRERGLLDAMRRVPRAALRELRSALRHLDPRPRRATYLEQVAGYSSRGNDAPLDLFVTAQRVAYSGSVSLGWDAYHKGLLRIHEVPGHHDTLLIEPQVHGLVERLTRSLQEAQRLTSDRLPREPLGQALRQGSGASKPRIAPSG
jgi:thioesterase domain-containing protein